VTGCRRQQAKGKKGGLEGWSLTRSKTKKGHVQIFKELKRERERIDGVWEDI
jgi:hypothetical protein